MPLVTDGKADPIQDHLVGVGATALGFAMGKERLGSNSSTTKESRGLQPRSRVKVSGEKI